MTDIANNGARFQRAEHRRITDVEVTRSRTKYICLAEQIGVNARIGAIIDAINEGRHYFVPVHTGLHCTDGVTLGDAHDHAFLAKRLRRAFTDVAIAQHQSALPGEQVIEASLDGVVKTVTTAVLVVVL